MNFITKIKIKNFFSVKDEISIDFKASAYNIEHNTDRLFEFNGEYYNKIISFYGANASGKTTILKAIITLAKVIKNEQTDNFPVSFKNKFANLDVNSEIEIGFVVNGKEYLYALTFESQKFNNVAIQNEQLSVIINENKTIFFDRENKTILNIDKKIQNVIFEKLSEKKSLFQEFEKFDESDILPAITSFFSTIERYSNISVYKTQLNTNLADEKFIGIYLDKKVLREGVEPFFLRFFNSINLDIEKVEVKVKEEDGKEKEILGLEIYHKIDSKEPLEFDLESDGTQMLMKILLDIYSAKLRGGILVIDEFDSILHPVLVPILNKLLIDNDIQIIYSTHNIYNMQFLQNDEIFLIEKDANHKTIVKPIKDNSDIKGYENLLTHYENGLIGGIPKIEDIVTKIF
ncbi:ATP-binding protein [Sulfurimonas sp.]|uniref:AAA family ATPase n=1 Tax=Sulfurimonas sp. TaxID=2022749 RepID=UPI0025E56C01|nr:ATP-binding protein [Sulfurimonas sp.]